MALDTNTIVAISVIALSGGAMAWQQYKAKKPAVTPAVPLTPADVEQTLGPSQLVGPISREQALKNLDALVEFFKTTGSQKGIEAIRVAGRELYPEKTDASK